MRATPTLVTYNPLAAGTQFAQLHHQRGLHRDAYLGVIRKPYCIVNMHERAGSAVGQSNNIHITADAEL